MDWIRFELEHPHGLLTDTDEVTPASPSTSATDAPRFSIRRLGSVRGAGLAPAPSLLPHQLRFPEPQTYWTA